MILKRIKKTIPIEGDYKITNHFAWLPTNIDGFKIWMEKYIKVYEWKIRDRSVFDLATRTTLYFKNCGGWDLVAVQRSKNKKREKEHSDNGSFLIEV